MSLGGFMWLSSQLNPESTASNGAEQPPDHTLSMKKQCKNPGFGEPLQSTGCQLCKALLAPAHSHCQPPSSFLLFGNSNDFFPTALCSHCKLTCTHPCPLPCKKKRKFPIQTSIKKLKKEECCLHDAQCSAQHKNPPSPKAGGKSAPLLTAVGREPSTSAVWM